MNQETILFCVLTCVFIACFFYILTMLKNFYFYIIKNYKRKNFFIDLFFFFIIFSIPMITLYILIKNI
jgi:hypothetical protein